MYDPVKINHLKIGATSISHLVLRGARLDDHAGILLRPIKAVAHVNLCNIRVNEIMRHGQ